MADERNLTTPTNVNEVIQDRNVRHLIGLQRLSTGVRDDILSQVNEMHADLVKKLTDRILKIKDRGQDLGAVSTERLNALLKDVEGLQKTAYKAAGKELTSQMGDISQYEMDFQTKVIEGSMPVAWAMTLPTISQLTAVVTSDPFSGKLMKEWVADLTSSEIGRVKQAVRVGLLEGETTDQIIRRIKGSRALQYRDGVLEVSRRHAETWVRTAMTHTTSRARELLFIENKDLIKGVKWISTLDTRTSPICQSRDGKVYPVDEGPRPPAHPNCRSATTPVLRSANDAGISKKALPVGRASMGGQVPRDLTYNSWLKTQPKNVVEEALGKKRAALFIKGDLPVDKFIDRKGTKYTLKELAKREAIAFDKAGI